MGLLSAHDLERLADGAPLASDPAEDRKQWAERINEGGIGGVKLRNPAADVADLYIFDTAVNLVAEVARVRISRDTHVQNMGLLLQYLRANHPTAYVDVWENFTEIVNGDHYAQ